MATMQKNTLKYTIPDWHTNNLTISTNTDRQCEAALNIGHQCQNLQNDTKVDTKWDQFVSNAQLTTRLEGIQKWRLALEYTKSELEAEIIEIQQSKESAEQQLADKNTPNSIAIRCATIRDARTDTDLINDLPTLNLQKEKRVLEGCRAKLQQKIDDAFQIEALLKECRQQLISDLVDKDNAIMIDSQQRNLEETSPKIYLKSNSTNVPHKSVTPQDWDDFSSFNKAKADSLMELSKTVQQDIAHTINQTSTDLEYQQQQTDLSLRSRVHEYQQASSQLEWQKTRLEEEIKNMESQVHSLEDSISEKYPPLKLAQTRLNNRTQRQHVELCRDNAQYALVNQVRQLETTLESLTEAHNQAKHALNCLCEQLYQTNQELDCKTASLGLDKECLSIRG